MTRLRGDGRCSPVGPVALCRKSRVASVASLCSHELTVLFQTLDVLSTCLCASVLNLDSLICLFFFLKTLRTLEAEHGTTSKARRADSTHFSDAAAQATFHRVPWLKTTARRRNSCHKSIGPAGERLQTAARRVRLQRPTRDRRTRPDCSPSTTSLNLRTFPRPRSTNKDPKKMNPFRSPKSSHPRTSNRPTSSRTSSEFKQGAHAKPSS